MLPKAHLTSHSRMSGSRCVITPLWLFGSWKSFLYSSSVYSCHLFLVCFCYVHTTSVLYRTHLCLKCSLGISNFPEEISVFPILLFSSISLHWSLRKAFLSLLAILWNSAFKWEYLFSSPLLFASLLFIAICKASLAKHFAFLNFFAMGMVLIPVSCTMSRTSFH